MLSERKVLLLFRTLIELFGCAYVYTKYGLGKLTVVKEMQKTSTNNALIVLVTLLLSTVTSFVFAATYVTFGLFKVALSYYLRSHHGSNYGGMLRYGDNNFPEDTQNTIHVVLLMKFEGPKEKFLDYAKDVCRRMLQEEKRLTSVRTTFLGYPYLLDNQLDLDDVFSSEKFGTDDLCNYETLCQFMQTICERKLPKDDRASFQVIAGEQHVVLDDDTSNEMVFPILLRLHHAICDGLTIISFLQRISYEGASAISTVGVKDATDSNVLLRNAFNWTMNNAPVIKAKDDNILKLERPSEGKNVAFRLETSPEYVKKVKAIKNSVPNGSFSSVLLAALSQALSNYFEKYNKAAPENIVTLLPTVRDKQLLAYESLTNVYTPALVTVPIKITPSGKYSNQYDRLRECIKKCKESMESLDMSVFYWSVALLSDVLPVSLVKLMISKFDISTAMLSSMPATKSFTILGHHVRNTIPFVPLVTTIGIGVCLVTYNNKFQLSICADAKIIPERSQVEELLGSMLKYVDDLYGEVLERKQILDNKNV